MLVDEDLRSIQEVRTLLRAAAAAQKVIAEWPQAQIDKIVEAMVRAGRAEVDRLAEMAVNETGFGVAADKRMKNIVATEKLWESIKQMPTVGIIARHPERGLIEIGVPMGVVAGIIPSTNPTSTALYKAIISVKAGNGIVLSPHPAAAKCIREAARIVSEAAVAAGAPQGIVGCMSVPTMQGTQELMSHQLTSVILATGGTGLVRAAYSSGKPAYGVGPGNVPAYIESSADIPRAVSDILASKTFDNGTVCASEQAVITDKLIAHQVIGQLKDQQAYFLTNAEQRAVSKIIVSAKGGINPAIVGQSPQRIAEMAGISIPSGVRALVAELTGVGPAHPLSMEKLSPILAYYEVDGWRQACELSMAILKFGGIGHTLAIHSKNESIIMEFALRKPAHRIIVNSPSTHGAIGLTTGLDPALTLGCGTPGGSITADNVTPRHLINIKRLAYDRRPAGNQQPPEAPSANGAAGNLEDRLRRIVTQVVRERLGGQR